MFVRAELEPEGSFETLSFPFRRIVGEQSIGARTPWSCKYLINASPQGEDKHDGAETEVVKMIQEFLPSRMASLS